MTNRENTFSCKLACLVFCNELDLFLIGLVLLLVTISSINCCFWTNTANFCHPAFLICPKCLCPAIFTGPHPQSGWGHKSVYGNTRTKACHLLYRAGTIGSHSIRLASWLILAGIADKANLRCYNLAGLHIRYVGTASYLGHTSHIHFYYHNHLTLCLSSSWYIGFIAKTMDTPKHLL